MKIRKIMAAGIAATMTLTSLTACGNKADFFQMLSNVASIKTGTETFTVKVICDDSTAVLTVTGATFGDNAVSLGVSGSINISDNMSSTGAVNINITNPISMVVMDDTVYIELAPLYDCLYSLLSSMDTQTAATLTPIIDTVKSSITAKYIKLDAESADSVSDMLGGSAIDTETEEGTAITTSELTSKIYTFANNLVDLFEKHFKGVEPSLISAEDGKYAFTVTKENFAPFADALINFIKTDFAGVIDSLATLDIPENPYVDTETLASLKSEENINELVNTVQNAKDTIADNFSEFNATCYIADNKTKDAQFAGSYSMGGELTMAITDAYLAETDGTLQKISFTFDGTINEYTTKGAEDAKAALTEAIASNATIDAVANSVAGALGMDMSSAGELTIG